MTENKIAETDFLARIQSHVADTRGVEPHEVAVEMSSSLRDDLEIDSLASVELTMMLDEHFGIELEDADVFESVTVSDLFRVVRKAGA